MLCQTCPIRNICKEACENLKRDLRKFESPQFETPISSIENRFEEIKNDDSLNHSSEQELAKIKELLVYLTFNERACIEKFYWEGKSQREIARDLGLTQSGVCRLISTAIHKLRESYSSPDTLYIGTLAA